MVPLMAGYWVAQRVLKLVEWMAQLTVKQMVDLMASLKGMH